LSSASQDRQGSPNLRLDTVQQLRVIREALESYRSQNGHLPSTLEDLSLEARALFEGAGQPFVYAPGGTNTGSALTRQRNSIVSMAAPTGFHQLDREKWAYIIVEEEGGKLQIIGY